MASSGGGGGGGGGSGGGGRRMGGVFWTLTRGFKVKEVESGEFDGFNENHISICFGLPFIHQLVHVGEDWIFPRLGLDLCKFLCRELNNTTESFATALSLSPSPSFLYLSPFSLSPYTSGFSILLAQ